MNFSGIARNTRLQQEPGVTAGRKWNITQQHHGAAQRHCSGMHLPMHALQDVKELFCLGTMLSAEPRPPRRSAPTSGHLP